MDYSIYHVLSFTATATIVNTLLYVLVLGYKLCSAVVLCVHT